MPDHLTGTGARHTGRLTPASQHRASVSAHLRSCHWEVIYFLEAPKCSAAEGSGAGPSMLL